MNALADQLAGNALRKVRPHNALAMTHQSIPNAFAERFGYYKSLGFTDESAGQRARLDRDRPMDARIGRAASELINEVGPTGLASFAPGIGDASGLVTDAAYLYNNPQERTLGNALLMGAGALPLVPAMTVGKKAKDELPMQWEDIKKRRKEQGFAEGLPSGKYTNRDWYHGTTYGDIKEFEPAPHGDMLINSVSLTRDPEYASGYAGGAYNSLEQMDNATGLAVYPLRISGKIGTEYDYFDAIAELDPDDVLDLTPEEVTEHLLKKGFVGIEFGGDEVAMLDTSKIRSRFARYDPANRGSSNIGASLAAMGILGAAAYPQDDQ